MVLRSKTKKLILVLVGLIFLNGCEASYTIIIDKNNINEKIEVLDNVSATRSVTDIMENYKKKYPVYDDDKIPEYDDFSIKYDNVEYYNQTYNIDENGYHLYYEYNYPVEKYGEANSLAISYNYKDITFKNNILSISMGSPNNRLKYVDEFTNLTVNIVTDYTVIKNNADSVIGNRYIWYVNKENNDTKKINFEVDLTQTQEELNNRNTSQEKKHKLTIPIVLLVVFIYIVIIVIIITKKKKKEV